MSTLSPFGDVDKGAISTTRGRDYCGNHKSQHLSFGATIRATQGCDPSVDCRWGKAPVAEVRTLGCIQCHSINGKGGQNAPDLGRPLGRNHSPADLTALMWNHAPTMWSAMSRQGVQIPRISEQDAADLFAYFYAARYFDHPADAARGKALFSFKHCAGCHGLTESKAQGVKPVVQWDILDHPVALVAAMWNHSQYMGEALANRQLQWPELSGQEVADLFLYVRTAPGKREQRADFESFPGNGKILFESAGCSGCHRGKLDLGPRLKGMTLNDIAAAMWNHAPKMGHSPPRLSGTEMIQIVSYLWAEQAMETGSNAAKGQHLFTAKTCFFCHGQAVGLAPPLPRGGSFTTISMVSALWKHGPQMLDQMKQNNLTWPRFNGDQMADVIAYLNSGKPRGRD